MQSIPGPNEKPQTYETIERIAARVEWNALTAQLSEVHVPVFGDRFLYLKGIATNLKAGDAILLVGKEREDNPGREEWDFRRISAVDADAERNRTRIDWAEGLGTTSPHKVLPAAEPKIYALRTRAGLFGFNAPNPKTLSNETLGHYNQVVSSDWPFYHLRSGPSISIPPIRRSLERELAGAVQANLSRALPRQQSGRGFAARILPSAARPRALALDTDEHLDLFDGSSYRDTLVFAQSELLEIAEFPMTEADQWNECKARRWHADGIEIGQALAASGKDVRPARPSRKWCVSMRSPARRSR